MIIALTVLHFLVCFFLIIVVLLQSGKAADLAGAFGGMGSQTAFGPRGSATVLSKATTIAAVMFMLTSMSLSILGTRGGGTGSTVLERSAPKSVPAAKPPAPQAPAGVPVVEVTPTPGETKAPAKGETKAPEKKK
jgi:preprotein translocase subunit SecG